MGGHLSINADQRQMYDFVKTSPRTQKVNYSTEGKASGWSHHAADAEKKRKGKKIK